jgi:hypothetical protein
MRVQPHHGLMAQGQEPRLLLPAIGMDEDRQGSPNMWRHVRLMWRPRPPGIMPTSIIMSVAFPLMTAIVRAHVGYPAVPRAIVKV